MAKEMVTITKMEYDKLLDDSRWLQCLEEAGVDNWQGRDEAVVIKKQWDEGHDA